MIRKRLRFGEFLLDTSLQRLTCRGDIVSLKPKAYDLLSLLLINRERVLSKKELLDWLWPRQDVGEANLSQTIYEIRKALGESARSARWIVNVPRRGYRFAGPVTEEPGPDPRNGFRSIAVIPFRSPGVESADSFMGLGMADAVTTALAAAGTVVVRPASAMLRYARAEELPDGGSLEIGRLQRVDLVLEGTVLRVDESTFQVTARLLVVADGSCVWADRFLGGTEDWFTIQDRISDQVASVVSLQSGEGAMRPTRKRYTPDSRVHALFMQGRYCWSRWTPDAWWKAVEYFQSAIALEADHAPSHAWLGATFATLGISGALPPREAFDRARASVELALALDPEGPDGHEILAAVQLFFDWDLVAARRSLDRAIELNPDGCNARHLRAISLGMEGRYAPALAEIHRALNADPGSLIALTDLGNIHYWGRAPESALHCHQETLRLEPRFAHARIAYAYALLAVERTEQALEEINRALRDAGRDPDRSGDCAHMLARAGERPAAMRILRTLEEDCSRHYIDPFQIALGHLGLNDPDRAFEWLRKALENRSRDLVLMAVDPVMDPLRDDPRFAGLMKSAGLDCPGAG